MLRLMVGIGRPEGKTSVERHVLGRFSRTEEPLLAAVLQQSVDLLMARLAQPTGGDVAARRDKPVEQKESSKP